MLCNLGHQKYGGAALRTTPPKCLSRVSERYFLIRNPIFLVFANEEKELIFISQKGRWNDEGRAIAPGIDSIIDLRPIFQRKGKIISRKNRIGCS
jgi:hypothetical protein